MSSFTVSVTPTRMAKEKKRIESLEPTEVFMAPFSAKSIAQFEDVPVTKTAKRILKVINPTEEEIQVKVTKSINPDHNLTVEWNEKTIPARGVATMEMVWIPPMDIACKETMQLTDNRNFRKDVIIILKSKSNKPTKAVRKYPSISCASSSSSSTMKTERLKSPKAASKSGRSLSQMHRQRQHKMEHAASAQPKWNSNIFASTSIATKRTFTVPISACPLSEQNVQFSMKTGSNFCQNFSSGVTNDGSSKENISPLTPTDVNSIIDKLKFTPATETKPYPSAALENLANLPTPIAEPVTAVSYRGIRPRRLTAIDLSGRAEEPETATINNESPPSEAIVPTIVINKTFEVSVTDVCSPNSSAIDESFSTVGEENSCGLTLNKTTTISAAPISRQLEMIREEETIVKENQTIVLEKTYSKPNTEAQDLKRDIKLIGTPLHKFSESMNDLSVKSPQSKNVIQQGSMPNLNEMECIRSFEQNRYFHKATMHAIQEDHVRPAPKTNVQLVLEESLDEPQASPGNLTTNVDFVFNQNEIRAQSSRFDLTEVDKKPHQDAVTMKNHKRRSSELSLSDSFSNESIASTTKSSCHLGVQKSECLHVSPPKRPCIDTSYAQLRAATTPRNASAANNRIWQQTKAKKLKLATTMSLTKKLSTPRKSICTEQRVKLYDTELYMQQYLNPDPFAATTTCDPFLAATSMPVYLNIEKHQIDFKKWLNALVSIPEDLSTDCNSKIDVGKLFNEVRNKELTLAPTKEEQCMNYLTKSRLEALRRAAVQLYMSEEMRAPCAKVVVYVSKNAIRIRHDRNLHLDIVMQRNLLELLLCFNPLWLRLGLEVVYGEKIHLHSNNDVVGLSTFILNRLFRDKFQENKHSRAYTLSDGYAEYIKRYTLEKILLLLLFLDKAKCHRIIKHNPCLFVKKSPYKETKDILCRFSSELLAHIGDIKRDLKRLGYVLEHKQTYLDEFDYAFGNLAVDLRDGVRLTRVMEIILLRDDLSRQLRVPAISRLQRIFNVNLALGALRQADFELKGDIMAADIVDGHLEKTFSLLWQLIYKFRSPKFHAAARVLQQWWRHLWLRVVIRRRIHQRKVERRERAARLIQAHFRGHITRKYVRVHRVERTQAALVLQKYIRRYLAQKQVAHIINAIVTVQRWYRNQRVGSQCRQEYLRLRECTVYLQRSLRRHYLSNKLLRVAQQLREERRARQDAAALCIQSCWRSFCIMKRVRTEFLNLRRCTIEIQRKYRATRLMELERFKFHRLRSAAIFVQRRYRANKQMMLQRHQYVQLRWNVVKMQQRRRSLLAMRSVRQSYEECRLAIVRVQRRVRATRAMKLERSKYLKILKATLTLQQHCRAYLAMKEQMATYKQIREKIIFIQIKWRAKKQAEHLQGEYLLLRKYSVKLQLKFRATKLMRQQRTSYQQLKAAANVIQQRYRAMILMRQQRIEYTRQKSAAVRLQRAFRAQRAMRRARLQYRQLKAAAIDIQKSFRRKMLMRKERSTFLQQREAAVVLQSAYRARIAMRKAQLEYANLKLYVICVQRRYRATLRMRRDRQAFHRQLQLIVATQRRFRATLLQRAAHRQYTKERGLIVKLQQRLRATLLMRRERANYLATRNKIIRIQRQFRLCMATRQIQAQYQLQRNAAITLQRWYRSILHMRKVQQLYVHKRNSSIAIQRRWRALKLGQQQRGIFLITRQKIILMQRKWRATQRMREERLQYQRLKSAVIRVQRRYRANRSMLEIRSQYLLIQSLIVCIQRKFRATRVMRVERIRFLIMKQTVVHLQQKFRGHKKMQEERERYLCLRRSVIHFQARVRGLLARQRLQALLTPEMLAELRRKKAAKLIQRYWRGYRVRKRAQNFKIKQIRKNIAALKQRSGMMRSIRKTVQDAVRFLHGQFKASEALSVLIQLDRLSRTVPHLLMDHSDFFFNFCYAIMAQAIRSEVDKQMLEYCSRILLNLSRYNNTTANTFQRAAWTTIAQILLRWCDKDCDIFNTLCTLIWVLAHCPKKREIICDFMTTPEAIFMLRETRKLVARKEKMRQNVRKPSALARCAPVPRSFSRSLPGLSPDYGVARNKPYIFISSEFAFETILCKLGIELS